MNTLRLTIFTLVTCLVGVNVNAQGKYGKTPEDSIKCLLNIQAYQTEYKSGNFENALVPWRQIYNDCPKASQNFYIHGLRMMRDLIGKTNDQKLKEARIDTLLVLYERRMEYFRLKEADKSELLYNRAIDIQNYRPDNNKAIYDAYLIAIEHNKNIDLMAAAKVMLAARTMFEKNEMSLEAFTNVYTKMSELADKQVQAAPDDTILPAVKAGIESAFLTTDAANCENLTKVLGARFNANKEDVETVKLVVSLLSTKECTEIPLYYESVEAYNRLKPSPEASYGLARMYYSKNEKEKAIQFFKEAVERETDALNKSKYYQEFGALYLKEKQVNQAITYARQSVAANPRNGKAYFLLGTAYGQVSGCGDEPVSKASVYWVAVDQFVRAKQLDASLSDEANKSISMYSQHFPLQTDAFFLNILDGETYQVKCGLINESTKVRTRK